MVDRLLEKTAPAVQFEPPPARTKGERTRTRILDIAYDSIVHKGFAATSIDELVEAAGITKSGFFYHFKDKNDLARQLLERFLAEDNQILDTLTERSRELVDDPLQSFLICLKLYADVMDDMPELHPGCLVATITYQDQMFDSEVRRMNADSVDRHAQALRRLARGDRRPPSAAPAGRPRGARRPGHRRRRRRDHPLARPRRPPPDGPPDAPLPRPGEDRSSGPRNPSPACGERDSGEGSDEAPRWRRELECLRRHRARSVTALPCIPPLKGREGSTSDLNRMCPNHSTLVESPAPPAEES